MVMADDSVEVLTWCNCVLWTQRGKVVVADVVHAALVGEVQKLTSKHRLHLEQNRKWILHTVHIQTQSRSNAWLNALCQC